jgi:hypothetical protein
MKRLGYEDSCRLLQSHGVIEDGIPPLFDRPPRHDDDRSSHFAWRAENTRRMASAMRRATSSDWP